MRVINQRVHVEVSRDLEEAGSAHSTADAHGDDNMTHAKTLAREQSMPNETLTTHAVRMSYGNRTTVDVQTVIGNPKFVAAVQNLYREGFVELPQTNILDLQTCASQQFGYREDWAYAHLIGLTTSDGEASEYAERFGTDTLCLSGTHDHARTGSIRELARIACGDRATWRR